MDKKFYVTTPIYYVNDVPHIGHAYTTIVADVLARYYRQLLGEKSVFFLTGTDEHGAKVAQAAEAAKKKPKEFCDQVVSRFVKAWKELKISHDYFIRTTDPRHEKIVQRLLQKVYDNGYIYEGAYEGLYCVGCEKFLTETDLVNNKCPLHPNQKPIHQKEKNYFFKLSYFRKKIIKAIKDKSNPNHYEVLPEERRNEILGKLNQGLDDVSISRAGVEWGIPIPWDKKQTTYVWFDALLNYYTATQFLKDRNKFWPANLHLIGKDILWFHAVIWQAFLLAAGLPLPKKVFAHGFFTINDQKMSKSLGNVISPSDLVKIFGVDGSRYLMLSAFPFGTDGDISLEKFKTRYNADLANGLGNVVARVAKLCENSGLEFETTKTRGAIYSKELQEAFENFRFDDVLQNLWNTRLHAIDKLIDHHSPWLIEDKNELQKVLQEEVDELREFATKLKPFLPKTAEKIEKQFKGPKIKTGRLLFPRLK